MSLKGKVVVITGASKGIGHETALAFAREGARIILTYNTSVKDGHLTEAACRAAGAENVISMKLDVVNSDNIHYAVTQVIEHFGHVDILVNNAGIARWKKFSDQTFSDIEHQIRTNLEGLIKTTLAFLPYVKETILNISSGAGIKGYPELAPYCATKFGVRGFTQALAMEEKEITILSVNPDLTATPMTNGEGRPAADVAGVILNAAKGAYAVPSGGDVNVWDYLGEHIEEGKEQ